MAYGMPRRCNGCTLAWGGRGGGWGTPHQRTTAPQVVCWLSRMPVRLWRVVCLLSCAMRLVLLVVAWCASWPLPVRLYVARAVFVFVQGVVKSCDTVMRHCALRAALRCEDAGHLNISESERPSMPNEGHRVLVPCAAYVDAVYLAAYVFAPSCRGSRRCRLWI